MRWRLELFGVALTLELGRADDDDNGTDPGDCTTQPVGFAPTGWDRWEAPPGGDLS